ncbi:MAG: tRNA (guanosine(37)-N1)-methyltransferase TrmD [Xanthomonadales bacterium]|nr:tRNA (guanosine(37)-N1)-methyltransferase TrmD [Gammaproteobacteria bacterium]MBT8073481.1 tRNA (guanosine(37)-N1)-methyltransferase TrmD [Gammaproteobacteria bacterium]NNK04323.1 tRNA (guanosine(37)-N1)-methyltransferase TrmD [Xanthomonadales bacterium]NNK98044.1 tRNA (guanosine(37)-N1)-methyltransferase TrmD [Xanthomonadales bacterium]
MRIDVITLFPESMGDLTGVGVTGRAIRDGKVELKTWNPRDWAVDRHRTVDDRPYGGGPGMVMAVEPLSSAIRAVRKEQAASTAVSLMSPQGRTLDQAGIEELAGRQGLILVCGRYEGIDERVIETEIDEEWSIGDYVISGGELAAAVIIDAVARLLPGVLGDQQSAVEDSFVDGLLDHPHYTRPEVAGGKAVPEVLLSGDHEAIRRWRRKQALGKTWLRRPDLLQGRVLDEEAKLLLKEFRDELENDS